jgi:hypothetical protein
MTGNNNIRGQGSTTGDNGDKNMRGQNSTT